MSCKRSYFSLPQESLPPLKLFPNKVQNEDTKNSEQSAGFPLDASLLQPHPPGPGYVYGGEKAKMLIQELESEETLGTGQGGACVSVVPEHSISVTECEGGRRGVRVKVTLPGVKGVKEVELEVSEVQESGREV